MSARCGKGPWLIRATPASAHTLFSGAPGNAITFNGSGTSGVAALKLGRRYTGIDLDPKYLELTKKRLDAIRR